MRRFLVALPLLAALWAVGSAAANNDRVRLQDIQVWVGP